MAETMVPVTVPPMDAHNRALVAHAHPSDWVNPEPLGKYNLVVIGGGTAGLVSAAGAAGLGAKVALIEKHLLGGDCLNVGCVPSKAVIRSSRAAADFLATSDFGVRAGGEADIDFGAVMERMRKIRARISHHDSAERFKSLGVDVFLGSARFSGPDTIEAAGKTLRFKKAVIASGARAAAPAVPGLAEAGYLTNETVFNLTERPRRLACVGGGPIGCELAQAFARLGCEVTLFHTGPHLLNREDSDAAAVVQKVFLREGIRLVLNARLEKAERGRGGKIIHYSAGSGNEKGTLEVDEILAAAGRVPNTEGLNLESAGVSFDPHRGVLVNDHLQTSNPAVFAAGDICMNWKFTHAADAAARIVIQNALFGGKKRLSALTMPWCTYTDPEIAHVGLYEREAREKGIAVATFMRELKDVDRAVTDGEEEGFVKIHVKKGSDRILGATVVARHAGDMIGELSLAVTHGIGLGKIAQTIHPYPTQAEAIKQTADAYNRTKLTPLIKKIFSAWLGYSRQ